MAANADTELLTEHFGYPPVSLIDEIINSINILADKALTSVETGLLNAPPTSIGFGQPASSTNANSKSKRKRKQPSPPPPSDAADQNLSQEQVEELARAEIAAGTHQLETLLCTSIDRNFDKFELYVMKNILCVRPEDRDWIRLGHYEGLNFDKLPPSVLSAGGAEEGDKMDIDGGNGSDENDPDTPTVESVNWLRRVLQASQQLNTRLVADKARNELLLRELRRFVGKTAAGSKTSSQQAPPTTTPAGTVKNEPDEDAKPPLAFLRDKGDLTAADAATPLTTTTAFALSQMHSMRALSIGLSNMIADLRSMSNRVADLRSQDQPQQGDDLAADGARRTWRKERVEYVEGAARRHLENVRGLELGRHGEVRDGEWQGEGGRLAEGEVGALESVVEMLGGQKGGGKRDAGIGDGDQDMEEEDEAQET